MAVHEVADRFFSAEEALWKMFGLEPMPYPVDDLRECRWAESGREVIWDEGSDSIDAGEIYGTSRWEADGHVMFCLFVNSVKRACLFRAENQVEEIEW